VNRSRFVPWSLAAALFAGGLLLSSLPALAGAVTIPLTCSRGPSGQHYDVAPTVPASVPAGGTYWVQLDGVSSGKISQTGLNFIFDMSYDYLIPAGAAYVDGSAQIAPGTGSSNVQAAAAVSQKGGVVTMVLHGHVDNDTRYTPPTMKFQLKATGAAGSALAVKFDQYRVTANAIVVGDVKASCDPSPRPFTVGTTTITAP
jgi:hypothetical protein